MLERAQLNSDNSQEAQKFSSPQEEIAYLRDRILTREKELNQLGEKPSRDPLIAQEIKSYQQQNREIVLEKGYGMIEPHVEGIVLDLMPETHDTRIEELVGIMHTKGVLNTLHIVEKLNSPHLEDDFHRFLVQYIKAGWPLQGINESMPLYKALKQTLYEVNLPETTEEDKERTLKEVISTMEQFYSGMLTLADETGKHVDSFTIELSNAEGSEEFVFTVSVPDHRKDLFEKQFLSIFPKAKIIEKKDDYNIFNFDGIAVGATGLPERNPIFPIKTYDAFEYDPLNVLLNTFSKINKNGEGAAIQIVIKPAGNYFVNVYRNALEEINKGVPLKEAIDIRHSVGGELMKVGKELGKEIGKTLLSGLINWGGNSSKDKEKDMFAEEKKPIDQHATENIKHKIESPIVDTNIRIITSAKSRERAETMLTEIESAFNQFDNPLGNRFEFERIPQNNFSHFVREFSFRLFSMDHRFPLNLKEVASFMHFPSEKIFATPQLRQAKAGTAPAPLELPREGTILGVNRNRNIETKVMMSKEDRLRHLYVIGQTGTGKTTLLKNLLAQDIMEGNGVCMIDPHGTDIDDIMGMIPPERYQDVIYFDPAYTPRPMALNMLEYDPRYPEQKIFLVNELLSIFNKLFDMKTAVRRKYEQYFRNATLLVMEDPETGNTLLDVSRVLSNKQFRELKLSRCKNPLLVQFWREIAEKAGGESSLQNMVPYITNKFDVFLSNDIMRPIISQETSSFNFREIMDNKKILLVNLAKGRLGDINANLIGLIIVGKILMAALSRVDGDLSQMAPFYLYIDEFQNITTNSISTILSEARKYKLSLNIAHQFIAQIQDDIKDAVFGNVGSIATFRVGADDAEYLEKQFNPPFTKKDIMNLDNRNAYIKMLANGKPVKPFNIETMAPPKPDRNLAGKLKELSFLTYGRNRAEVEDAIMLKYKKPEPPPLPPMPPLSKSIDGF